MSSRGEARSEARCHWAARFLPSLSDVAFVAPIAFLFLKLGGTRALLGDGDTGWHVRTGEWILANGAVPHKDLFSFTRPNDPWFAWEWLWDLGAGWLHEQWGMAAVVLASVFIISLTSLLLYRLILRSCRNPLIAIVLALLAGAASSIHWLARPHLLTILFTVIFYWMLERVREGNTRLLWLLPLLTVLWTNLHGGFVVGILLAGTYGAGEFLNSVFAPTGSLRQGWLRMRPYAGAALGCAAASLINPYFIQLHVHIYNYFADPYHFENISEFLSISFHHPTGRYFEALLVLGSAAAFAGLRRRDFTPALLVLSWAHVALLSARNIPLFAIVVAPPAARLLQDGLAQLPAADIAGWARRIVRGVSGLAAEIGSVELMPRIYLPSGVAMCVVGLCLLRPLPFQRFRSEYDPKAYPAKAIGYLHSTAASSRIYTDDEWGDYLVYKGFRVFVDGRSDFYGSDFGNKALDLLKGSYKWRRLLADYRVDTALLRVDSPLACALKEAHDWRVVYDDGTALVFRTASTPATAGPQTGVEVATRPASGINRDRAIAKTPTSDRKVTQSYARR